MKSIPEELSNQYQLRFKENVDYRNRVWATLCEAYFNRLIPERACVLDLGSGWGEFINHVQASEKYAMDLNPDSKAHLLPDIKFIQQDCSGPWQVEDGSLDVVFTSNFLEHLPDKVHVQRTILEALRCLKPGGKLICLGPNIKYVNGKYWDFWDHYVQLTESSLAELLSLSGFSIQMALPRFLPYSMSQGWKPPLFFLKMYLRLPIVWRLLGMQFLVIGVK